MNCQIQSYNSATNFLILIDNLDVLNEDTIYDGLEPG